MESDQRRRPALRGLPWMGLAVAALCFAAFSNTAVPVNSHDFWWHLESGEYLLDQGAIPESDPFTYTAAPTDAAAAWRIRTILGQYWLAQVIYAAVFSALDLEGIILLRGGLFACLALLVVVVLRASRARPLAWPLPCVLLLLALRIAVEDSDRPQVFSFLVATAVIALVEHVIADPARRRRLLLSVPLLWLGANLHAGYLVGLGSLVIYAGCARFEERSRPLRRPLAIAAALSAIATWFNPTHWAVLEALGRMASSAPVADIMEFRSPLTILSYVSSNPGWLAFWGLALLALPALLNELTQHRWSRAVLLGGTLAASLFSMRYIPFFVPIAAVTVASLMSERLLERWGARPAPAAIALILASAATVAFSHHPNNLIIRQRLRPNTFPTAAADYIAAHPVPKRLFAHFLWGGYLEHRLWPSYRLFIDSRELTEAAWRDYRELLAFSPRARGLLRQYRIGAVLLPGINPYTGQILPLVQVLAMDPRWSLAYAGEGSLLLVRARAFTGPRRPKRQAWLEILSELRRYGPHFPWLAAAYTTSAQIATAGLQASGP